jgi:hypothetical protein
MFFDILLKCIEFSLDLSLETQNKNDRFDPYEQSSRVKNSGLSDLESNLKKYSESELKSLRIRIVKLDTKDYY